MKDTSYQNALDAANAVLRTQTQHRRAVDADFGPMPDPTDIEAWVNENTKRADEVRRRMTAA